MKGGENCPRFSLSPIFRGIQGFTSVFHVKRESKRGLKKKKGGVGERGRCGAGSYQVLKY
ncbi:hypothetical protein I7I48_09659 [Histoplasma ohiense]|nr:hypothetical protein I7I48_09659 [Histoplasma ohiense (nom. inval.)]